MDTGTNVAEYEVRTAGRAIFITRSAGFYAETPVTCHTCGARTGLTLTACGEDTSITCTEGHTTEDSRLSREAVRDVAAAAVAAGVDVVPADALVRLRTRGSTGILPGYEDCV
ncbi:hypothetical protein ACWEN4_37265 [Streptomyces violaceorubidus]